MARCAGCGQEMTSPTTVSCTVQTVKFPDGNSLPSIPYGEEHDRRCHDCNVEPGGYHHPGCDMEYCPRCHGQLISCGCLDVEEENNDFDDWEEEEE